MKYLMKSNDSLALYRRSILELALQGDTPSENLKTKARIETFTAWGIPLEEKDAAFMKAEELRQ